MKEVQKDNHDVRRTIMMSERKKKGDKTALITQPGMERGLLRTSDVIDSADTHHVLSRRIPLSAGMYEGVISLLARGSATVFDFHLQVFILRH